MSKNFLNQDVDFPMLVAHCVKVMEALEGESLTKEKEWIAYSEGIGTKLMGHLVNIYSLYNGHGTHIKFPNGSEIKFIDFSSINILFRAALETYFCFYFIFIDSKNETEREFRFLIWDLAGYIERQGFATELKESEMIKNNELREMEELKNKIQQHECFNELSPTFQNRVLNANWKFGYKIPELAEKAGFNKERIGSLYSYLCGYSHSSRNSVMQVYQAHDIETQKNLASTTVGEAIIILANFIYNYCQLHEKAQNVHESNSYAKGCCEAWIKLGFNLKTSQAEVMEFIAHKLSLDIANLTLETTFEELGLNENQKGNLVNEFTSEQFITINEEDKVKLNTIGELVNYVKLKREATSDNVQI